jgi:hypothetical protein
VRDARHECRKQEMSESPATTNERPPAVASKPSRSFLDWLLARRELSRARQTDAAITAQSRAALKRAELAFELARDEQLQSETGKPIALELFRQSVYWVLCAGDPLFLGATPEAAWAAGHGAGLAELNLEAPALSDVSAVVRSTFIELAEGSSAQQRDSLKLIERVAEHLLKQAQSRESQLERAHMLRIGRVLLIIVPVLLLLVAFAYRYNRNLAEGAPWTTSSSLFDCHPERSECGGASTQILFHTRQEESPWFQYDFGKPLEFSSVKIRNRSDYGPELAVPLVVELSDDGSKYREVARRNEVFSTWAPSFGLQHARYLRVRALHKTYLHLEAIEVHP